MRRLILAACALFASCARTPTRPAGDEVGWPEVVAARFAGTPEPVVETGPRGVRSWRAPARDPRLPLPLALQPRDRDFLALLAEVTTEDVPTGLPGLPALLVRVAVEGRRDAGAERVPAAAVAFAMGLALTPLATDAGIGWLASFPRGAPDNMAAAAAELLAGLAADATFSASDVATTAEGLLVATRPRCLEVGGPGFASSAPPARTLARAHREDLVRLHRRVFVASGMTLAGTRGWPAEVVARLAALTRPTAPSGDSDADDEATDGGAPACEALSVLPAGWLATAAPDELARPDALHDDRFAQLAHLLEWLEDASLRRLPALRRLGPREAPRDVLTGDEAALDALRQSLREAGPALDVALAPLHPGARRGPSATLTLWLSTAPAPSPNDPEEGR